MDSTNALIYLLNGNGSNPFKVDETKLIEKVDEITQIACHKIKTIFMNYGYFPLFTETLKGRIRCLNHLAFTHQMMCTVNLNFLDNRFQIEQDQRDILKDFLKYSALIELVNIAEKDSMHGFLELVQFLREQYGVVIPQFSHFEGWELSPEGSQWRELTWSYLSPYLQRLTHLSLNGKGLKRIPHEIGSLQHLQVLDLRGNLLLNIPEEVKNLGHLKKLYLDPHPEFLRNLHPVLKEIYERTNYELIEQMSGLHIG